MTGMEKSRAVVVTDDIWLNLHRAYDVDRATLVWSALSSAYDRLLYAYQHLQLLRKIAKPAVTRGLETCGLVELAENEEDTDALFSESMHQVKMHVTDCLQHLHAVGDTVAFAIHFFIKIPKDEQLAKSRITLSAVQKLLEKNPSLPGSAVFVALLKELANNEKYAHLVDLNNHAKHRSIVKPSVSLPLDKEVSLEEYRNLLIFSTVEMSNPPESLRDRGATPVHEQRPIVPFIESELERIWNIYGQMRKEVDKQIRLAPSRAAHAD